MPLLDLLNGLLRAFPRLSITADALAVRPGNESRLASFPGVRHLQYENNSQISYCERAQGLGTRLLDA